MAKRIELTQGKYAWVSSEDFERVSKRKWSYHHSGYVVRGKPQISLHRFILGAKKGQHIDHINGDKLDNRRSNLRFCTSAQNQYNKRAMRGIPKCVSYRPSRRAWIVRIQADGKRHWVGYFKDFNKAVLAYKKAVVNYHGEYARV